jgi:hypothetical protein
MSSLRLIVGTAVVLVISIFFVLNQSAEDYPLLLVHNRTPETVTLTAQLAAGPRELGELPPDATRRFRVRDDAARGFSAVFTDGRELRTSPIYFTDGLTVQIIITADTLELERNAAR